MLIGIDGWYLGRGRGLGNHTRNLVEALSRHRPELSLVVYLPLGSNPPPELRAARVRWRFLPRMPFPCREQVILGSAARRDRVSVLHCPANTGPLHMPRGGPPVVLTIHDTIFMPSSSMTSADGPVSLDPYHRLGGVYRRWVSPRAARLASAVITVSEVSRAGIVTDLGTAAEKVRVIPGAHDARFRVIDAATARRQLSAVIDSGPFILALGAVDPRKNTERVLSGFASYRAGGGDRRLVIVGAQARGNAALRPALTRAGLHEHVALLGFVTADQLVALYNLADVLLYPSLSEGFGLPVLEAMACGTPVITSSTSALPEVAGNAALLVDPRSDAAIASALSRVLGDVRLRRELARRGAVRAAGFNWEAVATATAEVYRSVVGSPSGKPSQQSLQTKIGTERGCP